MRWLCALLLLVACEDSRRSRARHHDDDDGQDEMDQLQRFSQAKMRKKSMAAAAAIAATPARCAGIDCYPDVTIVDLDGRGHARAELDDHVVIVEFWASWATASVEMLSTLQTIADRYTPTQVFVVGITSDASSYDARQTAATRSVAFPIATFDGLQGSFEAPGSLPTIYVYDRTGRRVASKVGAYSESDLATIVYGLL